MPTSASPKLPHSQWRNCQCPFNKNQSGVCGCPQFWERKNTRTQPHQNSPALKSLSTKPSDPPREICFFWYHGRCRRGDQCTLAHESYITWPMTPPPGFVHFEPCELALCPLRKDLVALKRDANTVRDEDAAASRRSRKKRRRSRKEIGGQLDGGVCSSLRSSAAVDEEYGPGDEVSVSADDTDSLIHNAYSDLSSLENDGGGVSEMKAQPDRLNDAIRPAWTTPPATTTNDTGNERLCHFTPPSLCSEGELEPMVSVNHTETLGKRKWSSTSHHEVGSSSNNNTKRNKGEMATKTWYEPSDAATPLSSYSSAPEGLYEHSSKLICFYWYHKGYCIPKRNNGQEGKCMYAHNLDVPVLKVSMPPNIRHHRNCSLPLCPKQVSGGSDGDVLGNENPGYQQLPIHGGFSGRHVNTQRQNVQGWRDSEQARTLKLNRQVQSVEKLERLERRKTKGKEMQKVRQSAQGSALSYEEETKAMDTTTIDEAECPAKMMLSTNDHPRVLVEYELPMGDARLEWDTDCVRRLFGEIE